MISGILEGTLGPRRQQARLDLHKLLKSLSFPFAATLCVAWGIKKKTLTLQPSGRFKAEPTVVRHCDLTNTAALAAGISDAALLMKCC